MTKMDPEQTALTITQDAGDAWALIQNMQIANAL